MRPIPFLIFSSRWLQLPLYIGLIVAQGLLFALHALQPAAGEAGILRGVGDYE